MRAGVLKASCLEIDPTARRQEDQKLKSAAPGAPYGWDWEGKPYTGTAPPAVDARRLAERARVAWCGEVTSVSRSSASAAL